MNDHPTIRIAFCPQYYHFENQWPSLVLMRFFSPDFEYDIII